MVSHEIPDYGDFVNSDEEGDVEDESEPLQGYENGGYYPVCLGEILVDRYRIEHKLGWGGYSTVWMAYDMQSGKNVALKILVQGEKGDYEYRMHNEIREKVSDPSHLVLHEGSFTLPGQGTAQHRVLVLSLLHPSLGFRTKLLPIEVRLSAAKQLLVALEGLHRAGLVHRDLNEGVMMWGLQSALTESETAAKYQLLGRPKKVPLGEHLWKRGELVQQITPPPDLSGSELYLGDFGLTIKDGTSVSVKPQAPYCLCAPERLHGQDPSLASDMWSYMCLFAAMHFGANVFYGNGGQSTAVSWVEQLGAMPAQWKGKCWYPPEVDDAWYDQATVPDPKRDLRARIARIRPETRQHERQLVLSLFQKAFCYLPEQHITAKELLPDSSFEVIMRIYHC